MRFSSAQAPKAGLSEAQRLQRVMAALDGTPAGGLIRLFEHIPADQITPWPLAE